MDWLELLLAVLAIGGAWFWLDTLKAREAGMAAARRACEADGLQLLDETVAGRVFGMARDGAGRLRLRRVYGFEFSDTGDNRRTGEVALLGQEVEWLRLRPKLYLVPMTHDNVH